MSSQDDDRWKTDGELTGDAIIARARALPGFPSPLLRDFEDAQFRLMAEVRRRENGGDPDDWEAQPLEFQGDPGTLLLCRVIGHKWREIEAGAWWKWCSRCGRREVTTRWDRTSARTITKFK